MTHDKIIPFLVDKLQKYPDIKFHLGHKGQLTIEPANDEGFKISLWTNKRENTLYFSDFYHWHFDNTENEQTELLNQVLYGLTGVARIKVFTKNDKTYKCSLEIQDKNKQWGVAGTTSSINLNFWTPPKFHYLKNNLLPIDKMSENQ